MTIQQMITEIQTAIAFAPWTDAQDPAISKIRDHVSEIGRRVAMIDEAMQGAE